VPRRITRLGLHPLRASPVASWSAAAAPARPGRLRAYLRRTIVNLATSHPRRRRRVERDYLERSAGSPDPWTDPNEELDATMHDAPLRLARVVVLGAPWSAGPWPRARTGRARL